MTEMIPRPDITCSDAIKARELATGEGNARPTTKTIIEQQERITRHFYRTGWKYTRPGLVSRASYTYEVDENTTITITENNE